MRFRSWFVLAGVCLATSVVSAARQERPLPRPEATPQAPISAGPAVTFSKDVAPILHKHCTGCHRPGTVAPMSLLTYADARPYAKGIRNHVIDGAMPPWHADQSVGRFANARILSEAEKQTLLTWANTGSKEGDPRDMPPAPTYTSDWAIGTPDLVWSMDREFEVPTDGTVEYQYFLVPSGLGKDVWVQAMEIRSSAPEVVHHVLVFDNPPTRPAPSGAFDLKKEFQTPRSRAQAPEGGGGSLLMAFAGGTGPRVLPAHTARRIAAGSVITFQVHYNPNGKAVRDRTSIGLKFASEAPKEEIRMVNFSNGALRIPPGADSHRVDAEIGFVKPVRLWGIAPHAHLRGKAFEYRLAYPDGRTDRILSVPRYDSSWQVEYMFETPLDVPAGARLLASAWYDNSRNNRNNPDPTVEVLWGDQTWEEMMFNWFSYSLPGGPISTSSSPSAAR
jgi:hypothetical protein